MIPQYIQPFLWSYDTKRMNFKKDKKRIIINVLNLGTKKATDWLFKTYTKQEIKTVFKNSLAGEWNKKSLNFWSFIFNLNPKKSRIK